MKRLLLSALFLTPLVALPLLAAQVELANGGIVQLADTGPAEPLRFVARIPARLDAWQLTVRDPDGRVGRLQAPGKQGA